MIGEIQQIEATHQVLEGQKHSYPEHSQEYQDILNEQLELLNMKKELLFQFNN